MTSLANCVKCLVFFFRSHFASLNKKTQTHIHFNSHKHANNIDMKMPQTMINWKLFARQSCSQKRSVLKLVPFRLAQELLETLILLIKQITKLVALCLQTQIYVSCFARESHTEWKLYVCLRGNLYARCRCFKRQTKPRVVIRVKNNESCQNFLYFIWFFVDCRQKIKLTLEINVRY